jgi:Na+/melibiose symporter-like transporter
MVPAYVVITAMHLAGAGLTLRTDAGRNQAAPETHRPSHWLAMREGLAVVWRTPRLLAAMCLAALVNFCAFPFTGGLMPYVAREVYGLDQRGLGVLIAAYGAGALIGSISMGALGGRLQAGRLMLAISVVWYGLLLGFAFSATPWQAAIWLAAAGIAQSISMLALQMLLMQTAAPQLRGRIMGVRMLAIYPLPLGLLLAGALIPLLGFHGTATAMLCGGMLLVLAIALAWRKALLPAQYKAQVSAKS